MADEQDNKYQLPDHVKKSIERSQEESIRRFLEEGPQHRHDFTNWRNNELSFKIRKSQEDQD